MESYVPSAYDKGSHMNLETQNRELRFVEHLLPSTISDAQLASRWVTKQTDQLQIHLEQRAHERYFELKRNYPNAKRALLGYVARLHVHYGAYDLYKKAQRKNPNIESVDLLMVDMIEASIVFGIQRRESKKYRYLKRKQAQLLKWREMGYSYRTIASRLLTPDGRSISYEYLRRFLSGIEKGEV